MNPFEGQERPAGLPADDNQTAAQPAVPAWAPQPVQPQGAQPQYAQPVYGQPQYGQAPAQGQPYPQQPYPQQPYPTQPYGQPPYDQQPAPQGYAYPPQGYAPQYQQPYPAGVYAPAGSGLPLQPVVAKSRTHKFRWAIAGAIVLSVALVTAAGAFVLSGASGSKSLTASMAPKNTWMFVELRTDLPGDQHQKLADFLSHFPGFADRAQFDNALDEIFNRITGSISPDLAYTSAFKPWMEGEVSVAVLPGSQSMTLPSLTPVIGGTAPMSAMVPDAVVLVALKDRAKAETWVTSELSQNHITATSQTYAGETMYTLTDSGEQGAYAFTNQDLVLGTPTAVKASLDTKSNGSLADNANYQAAMKSLSGDALARFYMDPKAYLGSVVDSLSMLAPMVGASAVPAIDLSKMPSWIGGSVRAESDRMVMEAMAGGGTSAAAADNHTSQIATRLPGDTVAVFEDHSLGKQVNQALDNLSQAGSSMGIGAEQIAQVKDALSLIGGVDWIQDAAVAVTDTNGTFGGGLVVQTPDATTAKTKLAMLTNFVALAGGSTGLKSSTETYNGQTITVITVPQTSTGTAALPATPAISIGLTVKDNLIVAGYQDTFAKAVIDTTSSNALSAQSDYSSVMNAVGSSNTLSFYLNVPALEDQIGKAAMSSASWNTNYKPYFDHLGGIGYAVIGGDTTTVRVVLMAR